MRQAYDVYQAEDFEVWSILYNRQLGFLRGRVYDRYFDDIAALGFTAEEIPRFDRTSERLEELTGWTLYPVEDYVEPADYLALTATRRQPATTFLRSMDELDHCKRPDIFHDVFGHGPLLMIPGYSEYLISLSTLALEHVDDEEIVGLIANFNKWVSEFGLIECAGEVKAYGAGILSSSGELDHALGGGARQVPADVGEMVATPHQRAELQPQYFVIPSFRWLRDAVPALRSVLERR